LTPTHTNTAKLVSKTTTLRCPREPAACHFVLPCETGVVHARCCARHRARCTHGTHACAWHTHAPPICSSTALAALRCRDLLSAVSYVTVRLTGGECIGRDTRAPAAHALVLIPFTLVIHIAYITVAFCHTCCCCLLCKNKNSEVLGDNLGKA